MFNKLVQMSLRSLAMAMLLLGFFYNSENVFISRIDNFVMLGACGSYTIVMLGLLIEVGLQLKTDKVVEAAFLIGGIAMNLLSATLAFINFYSPHGFRQGETINNGVVTVLAIIIISIDIVLLLIH